MWTTRVLLCFLHVPPPAQLYTLSLHDALPISEDLVGTEDRVPQLTGESRAEERARLGDRHPLAETRRSEEHTSELQSRGHLVCRLLLEKKKRRLRDHDGHTTDPSRVAAGRPGEPAALPARRHREGVAPRASPYATAPARVGWHARRSSQ